MGVRFAVQAVTIALVLASGLKAQSPEPEVSPSDRVIIREEIPTDYEARKQELERLLSNSRAKDVRIPRGETLSGLISKSYGVGASNAPRAYAEITSEIAKRNSLEGEKLVAGDHLELPDLPRMALSQPNQNNPNNAQPKLVIEKNVFLFSEKLAPTSNLASAQTPVTIDRGRVGSTTTVRYLVVTRAEAAELQRKDANRFRVTSAPMPIIFAQGSGEPSLSPVKSDDALLLQNILSHSAHSKPVLYIFDESWPSDEDFVNSKAFLIDAINKIREDRNLAPTRFSKQLIEGTHTRYAVPLPDGSKKAHAQLIKLALAPYRALEPADGRVQVVYVPLFPSQVGAYELLQHIVALNLEARDQHSTIGDPLPEYHANYWKIAGELVATANKKENDGMLRTDQGIVQAVLWLCRNLSEATGQPYFVNMSWMTPNLDLYVDVPADGYGLFVVAAGNEGTAGETFFARRRQFAYRSLNPGDMLAVMNVKDDGTIDCNSNAFGDVPNVFGVSYPGDLGEGECGTSFSAPRVAWLFAARQSMFDKPSSVDIWKSTLRSDLGHWTDSSASNYNRIRLSIPKFFSNAIRN